MEETGFDETGLEEETGVKGGPGGVDETGLDEDPKGLTDEYGKEEGKDDELLEKQRVHCGMFGFDTQQAHVKQALEDEEEDEHMHDPAPQLPGVPS